MTALADPATWRTAPYYADAFVYLSRPATVFAARVNQASATYPATSLTYDGVTTGAFGDIKPGMTLLLGTAAGLWDLGMQRVRAAATSTAIPVGRSSRGELVGELRILDDAYITVLKERRVWAKIPRIDGTTIYKDEQTYADSIALAPVVVMGSDYFARVDPDTGLITVTFNDNSYALVGSIASRLWDFDGGTITSGTTTSAGPVTVTFPPGEYDVSLAVTDSNGYVSTGYRWIVAVDRDAGDTYAAIPVRLGTLLRRIEGQDFEFTVVGSDLPRTTYYPGTRVGVFLEEHYGSSVGSLNSSTRGHVKYTGWLQTETSAIEAAQQGLRRDVRIVCADASKRLTQIPKFADVLHRKATATTWNHIKTGNAHLNGAIFHYLRNNTTVTELADVRRAANGNSYTFSLLAGEKGNPYEQADRLARAMRCRLTCNSRGRLDVNGYPNYLPTAAQAASFSLPMERTSTVIVTLEESDWTRVEHEDGREPKHHWNNGSAIQVSTQDGEDEDRTDTPLFTIAPGKAPGQGASAIDSGEQLCISQDELNVIEGHRYKTNNAPEGLLQIELTRGGDAGIEPADLEWIRLNVSASAAAQRGVTFTNAKMLPIEVRFEFGEGGVVRQFVTAELEQIGQPGQIVTHPVTTAPPPPNPGTITPPLIVVPQPASLQGALLYKGTQRIGVVYRQGFALTTTFGSGMATAWTLYDHTAAPFSMLGNIVAWIPDGFAPGKGWVCTDLRLYYVDFNALTATDKLTWSASGQWGGDASFAQQNYAVFTNGNIGYATTDNSTFNLLNASDGLASGGSGLSRTAPAYVSSHQADYGVLPNRTSAANMQAYASSDAFVTWALLANPLISATSAAVESLHYPWHDNASDALAYYSRSSGGAPVLLRDNSGSPVDITPSLTGGGTAILSRGGIGTYVGNRRRLLVAKFGTTDEVWTSDNGHAASPTYTRISAADYNRAFFAGDNPGTIYLVAFDSGKVGLSTNGGLTTEEQTGDILTQQPTWDDAIAIFGW